MKKTTLLALVGLFSLNVLAADETQEITLKPDDVTGMKYTTPEITVKAGKKVKITFDNSSKIPQPHNMLIIKPGTLDEVGALANKMLSDPTAMSKGFIPESDKILFKMNLVQPGGKGTLEFTAPAEPGDYPFACTFPGHWLLMRGVMKVTKE